MDIFFTMDLSVTFFIDAQGLNIFKKYLKLASGS